MTCNTYTGSFSIKRIYYPRRKVYINTPLLLITGFADIDREEARELGALDLLEKPVDFEKLLAKLPIASILVEGGPKTWATFKNAGLVDEEVTLVGPS